MILCIKHCIPCCDFCIHVIYETWKEKPLNSSKTKDIIGGPIGCKLHKDQEHQQIAINCSYCNDFQCFEAIWPQNWIEINE